MNADDLLDQLLARGIAREMPNHPLARAVRINSIEVAISEKPLERHMRARWRERAENMDFSYLLLADDPARPDSVCTLGPITHRDPIRSVDCSRLADAIESTAVMSTFDAVRHLTGEVIRLDGRGKIVHGLLTNHTLESRFRGDAATWQAASESTGGLAITGNWQSILHGLGYEIERLPQRGYLARYEGRPVAMVHPRADPKDFIRLDSAGRPTEGVLASDCLKHNLRYGILASGNRYRLFDCDPSATTAEWLDLDAELLDDNDLPYLALLAPQYLADEGLIKLQADARAFGAELRLRLDRTVRQEALPALAQGLEHWAKGHDLDLADDDRRLELERAALTLLFRLLFVLYAESSHFLPVDNDTYRRRSLSELVTEAQDTRPKLSETSTSLWSNFNTLVRALRTGNPAWGVPAYNGALFAAADFEGAELLEQLELADPFFADVLIAVGRDTDTGSGVDYSSLEIGHLGHIYEALLSLRLSLTHRPVRYDIRSDRYVPDDQHPDVLSGSLLWQTNEGGRKSGGVYYTPVSLVEHLVRHTVLPAFERHLEEVHQTSITDPRRAATDLLSFSVLDPACGSAHFLVQVTEALADRTVAFLANRPLPAIRERLDRLRAQTRQGVEITDVALLRRLILKHCIFGVDLSPMGAEIATLSLWLASFVPGLSLSYLDRNVIVGNSLIGVADPASVVTEGTIQAESLQNALDQASQAVSLLAGIDDLTPDEVHESKAADKEARQATIGLQRLFDLWTAEGFDLTGARVHAEANGLDVIAGDNGDNGNKLVEQATALCRDHHFLHWPLTFPRVFFRERPGFDVVVGNPPWEELTVEELSFYGLHLPGLHALAEEERADAVAEFIVERPDLTQQLRSAQEQSLAERKALATGEYHGTAGDPDLYKYFCQRYKSLVRHNGAVGVVLPRAAFVNKGSEGFRDWLYTQMSTRRIDFLENRKLWIFDTHPQFGIALVVAERRVPNKDHQVSIAGTADSPQAWKFQSTGPGIRMKPSTFAANWMTPKLRSQDEADLLAKLRVGSPFPLGSGSRWQCFPIAELHETNNRYLWHDAEVGLPLWKGESFDQYDPHGSEARVCPANEETLQKVRKPRPGNKSLLAETVAVKKRQKAVRSELTRARVAFRDVTNATNSRTVLSVLVPPRVFLTNKAPYLAFVGGSELDQTACLGIMNSLPLDWQARRFVALNLNFFILEALVVPNLSDEHYQQVAFAAARLSAVDERFAEFAAATGVECGPLTTDEHQRLRVEIDARVARGWNLTVEDLRIMFDDFTTDAVSSDYRTALVDRLRELA
ncbi:MAG: hypothetical protein OXH61_15030 [Acidimicrobiaceae bacterium]|nr:hypothetical protein [Acidimicrobiaceae bacterium]